MASLTPWAWLGLAGGMALAALVLLSYWLALRRRREAESRGHQEVELGNQPSCPRQALAQEEHPDQKTVKTQPQAEPPSPGHCGQTENETLTTPKNITRETKTYLTGAEYLLQNKQSPSILNTSPTQVLQLLSSKTSQKAPQTDTTSTQNNQTVDHTGKPKSYHIVSAQNKLSPKILSTSKSHGTQHLPSKPSHYVVQTERTIKPNHQTFEDPVQWLKSVHTHRAGKVPGRRVIEPVVVAGGDSRNYISEQDTKNDNSTLHLPPLAVQKHLLPTCKFCSTCQSIKTIFG